MNATDESKRTDTLNPFRPPGSPPKKPPTDLGPPGDNTTPPERPAPMRVPNICHICEVTPLQVLFPSGGLVCIICDRYPQIVGENPV